jgi:hypothetical protein
MEKSHVFVVASESERFDTIHQPYPLSIGNRDTVVRARYPRALKWLPVGICLDGGYGRRKNAPSAISLVKVIPTGAPCHWWISKDV